MSGMLRDPFNQCAKKKKEKKKNRFWFIKIISMNARCPQVTSIQITKHSGRFPIVFIARLFFRLCMVSVCFISLRIIWFLQQASITRNFASKSELVLSQVFRDLPSSRCTTWADYSKWTGANGFERSSGTEKLIVAKTFIFFFFFFAECGKEIY